jgi:hypothetical protein
MGWFRDITATKSSLFSTLVIDKKLFKTQSSQSPQRIHPEVENGWGGEQDFWFTPFPYRKILI